jgi:A/G-specific adenine glycosylase
LRRFSFDILCAHAVGRGILLDLLTKSKYPVGNTQSYYQTILEHLVQTQEQTITKRLLAWYAKHGRHDLPWKLQTTPYRVWISEIMLQQTQVMTVIPYFERFMQRFPSVQHLALAPEDEVLKHWSGLGYYARARNLHKTAQIIHTQYHDSFPSTLEELEQLPGIGRSTAGAILSLAMEIRAPILDGNVKRVLCRLYAIEGWPGKNDIVKRLWKLAEALTPSKTAHHYNQAIMDLGAKICKPRQPLCNDCPLSENCQAHLSNAQAQFPHKKPRNLIPLQQTQMLLIQNHLGHVLLEKRPPIGIWPSLWALPECPMDENVQDWCQKKYLISVKEKHEVKKILHTFSHFKLEIHLKLANVLHEVSVIMQAPDQLWYNTDLPLPGGIAAPLKKILDNYKTTCEAL